MKINILRLSIIFSILYILFYNNSFFNNIVKIYPFKDNILFVFSLAFTLFLVIVLLFLLFLYKKNTKVFLLLITTISAFCAYFMDSYGVVIDNNMIINAMQTNSKESFDLLSIKLALYLIFLAVLPILSLLKVKIEPISLKKRVVSIFLVLVLLIANLAIFNKNYTSFFREHKILRFYTNPTYWIYSTFYILFNNNKEIKEIKKIANDVNIKEEKKDKEERELIIFVVGETARADRFSLNGYSKKTNPLLEQEKNIINFTNAYSCGTSTAYSLPCMFSFFSQNDYSYYKAASTQNILDVLNKTKNIDILWRDNNSDSKGVALRVKYEDFKNPKKNPICDIECRDEGMLYKLDEFIKNSLKKDIFIILHQMGSHGPAYYKRYPKEFEKFTPICKTNQLEKCTKEQISNAYDNTILYTDYFLSKVINFLKKYDKDYEVSMFYMSDHGESLGENGIYLHGMPYFLAPKEQTHIPAIIWVGEHSDINISKAKELQNTQITHDNIFSTLLGLFEVKTKYYNPKLDILKDALKKE